MRVTLTDVGHWFDPHRVLFSGVSLTLIPGYVYGVTGPSGSGKSTLLSLLAGWSAPQQGRIDREGIARVQWVFQNPFGVARRTVVDHVSWPLIAQGLTRAEATRIGHELLARFGLAEVAGSCFEDLSGGESQRLMLARGVTTQPDLLLVDEPTAQLDRHTAAEVNAVLAQLSGVGRIVVVATHDPQTQAMCGTIIDLGGEK